MPENTIFCENCGNKPEAAAPAPAPAPSPAPSRKKGLNLKKKHIAFIGGGAAVLIAALIVALSITASTDKTHGTWLYFYGSNYIDLDIGFHDGLAAVMREDRNGDVKWGFIDKKGNVVIPFVYEGAGAFSEGLAAVRREDRNGDWKSGFIDKKGNEVIPFVYNEAYVFSEGLALVGSEDRN